MRIFSKHTLAAYWEMPGKGDSEDALDAWHKVTKSAVWRSPVDIKRQYRNCSPIGGNRVVFNIAGNKYRLVVEFNFRAREPMAFIRFIGTHREYDKINAEEV
jgi:mRNA interferase HigB